MNFSPIAKMYLPFLFLSLAISPYAEAKKVSVDDAYVESSKDGQTWTIGTKAIELTYGATADGFCLISYKNKLCKSDIEYVDPAHTAPPFSLKSQALPERFQMEQLWTKSLVGAVTVDLAADNLQVEIQKDEMIGFGVGPRGNYAGDQVRWPSIVTYEDGESFASASAKEVEQGPLWFYYVHANGTGFMEPIDATWFADNVQELIRMPSPESGFRAPGNTPHVGSTVFHPCPEYDAVRVWKAPKSGKVTLSGLAEHVGGGDVDLYIYKIKAKAEGEQNVAAPAPIWTLTSASAVEIRHGGRPALQFDAHLTQQELTARLHIQLYPRTPILRQWVELENRGAASYRISSPSPALFQLRGDNAASYVNYWMIGGNSLPNQGKLEKADITPPYQQVIQSFATDQYVPWMALLNKNQPGDGHFQALDFLGNWQHRTDWTGNGPLQLSAVAMDIRADLKPGETYNLPLVTFGVFRDNLDTMAESLYNWQYEYMWDYTHDDYYAKMPFTVAWYGESDNLQQQWAGHLGDLDFRWIDYLRTVGMELLWEDAGWSASKRWWEANMEGPDFALTNRYLPKLGMKLIVWIPGHQDPGLIDTKVGSWGNFQRRTDGMGFDAQIDKIFRKNAEHFLHTNLRCSFHTCSGGSRYAHTFEVQRYTDVNYDTDGPGSNITNCYFSYLETPDKWFDNLCCWQPGVGVNYRPEIGRRYLTQVPKWGLYIDEPGLEGMRQIADLYHYLLQEGVAGRWSYITHPLIRGDEEFHYCQRISYDRKKSIIIFKHLAENEVTIYPRGLLPKEEYTLDFDSIKVSSVVTGADLMKNGIVIRKQQPEELIYLNLPNHPGSRRDKTAPSAPARIYKQRENNIGYNGTALYWSPGSDNNWISYYEVQRDGVVLGKVSTGTFYFDYSPGWDPKADYQVRTVDGDGNGSDWKSAQPLRDEPLTVSVLGGHFAEADRDGWSAEITTAENTYEPMTWIPPANRPSADLGGTTNQPGGAEGYWQAAETARLGRGWQQAAAQAASVRKWTAARAGTVRVLGRAIKDFYHIEQGQPLKVRILQNDKQVWPEQDWAVVPLKDRTGITHNLILNVAVGDQLRFILAPGTEPENDILVWMPNIEYLEENVAYPSAVVRILCGAKKAYTDRNGNVWSEDKYFDDGSRVKSDAVLTAGIPALDDNKLYQYGREGKDFTYSIPVPAGLYCLRLKFAETKYENFFERPFNLSINGKQVLHNFDICHAARGPRRSYDRLFRYLVPNGDGRIELHFTDGWEPLMESGKALVQAIELTPEIKPTIRINAGSETPFVDWNSYTWSADAHYEGGSVITSDQLVEHASPTLYDQGLYQTARTGKTLRYSFAVTPGLYNVHLKFAELWLTELGQRPMDIAINGRTLWSAWDPAAAANKIARAAEIRAQDITPDDNGNITIQITATGSHDAILQGIEIE